MLVLDRAPLEDTTDYAALDREELLNRDENDSDGTLSDVEPLGALENDLG